MCIFNKMYTIFLFPTEYKFRKACIATVLQGIYITGDGAKYFYFLTLSASFCRSELC